VKRKPLWIASGAAALFLLLHLVYLPQSLEDVDSINFAMGVRAFDVAHHQPHPPGYPVYIAAAKALHAAGASEVHALALLSAVAASTGLIALFIFFSALDPGHDWRALGATALAVSAPLYWLSASRPLTDAVGLAAAVAIQAVIVAAETDRALVAASFLCAFATGVRSQVAWLTVPLLIFAIATRRRPSGKGSGGFPSAAAVAAFVIGGCAWGVPLVMLTGGPSGYWRAIATQGSEDLTNIVMLWTTHTLHELEMAIYYAFVAAWASPVVATAVLALAAAGFLAAFGRPSRPYLTLAAAFVPYFLFDLVFQETITTRYALPLVVPVAYFAALGACLAGPRVATIAIAVVAAASMHVGGTSLAAYASQPAPAFRLLDGMLSDASEASHSVLAMHRREDFDLRRPIAWAGAPAFAERLPAPAKHEWLELVKYWNRGGRDTVWFIADPLRSDLALVGTTEAPKAFHYTLDYPILLGGTRPYEMDWHAIDPPDWYAAEGWSLTPETAGIAKEDHKGPGIAPIDAWVRREPRTASLMVGGRNLATSGAAAHVRTALDRRVVDEADVPPGFFLREIDLPAGALSGDGDYAHLTISSTSDQVAIEQFDAQPTERIVVGYGEGWHEREYNPATGAIWRWTSDHGELRVRTPQQRLVLELAGDVEAASKSRVTIRLGDRIIAAHDIGATFSIRQEIPREFVHAGANTITIATDQAYVPAERRSRSQDRRLLGLKIYTCRVTPAS
jgi:hypothetical protein